MQGASSLLLLVNKCNSLSQKNVRTAVMKNSQHRVTGHGIQEVVQGQTGNTSAMAKDQKEKKRSFQLSGRRRHKEAFITNNFQCNLEMFCGSHWNFVVKQTTVVLWSQFLVLSGDFGYAWETDNFSTKLSSRWAKSKSADDCAFLNS